MKRLLALIIPVLLLLTDCGSLRYPELPEDPIAFDMGEYIDHEDDDAAYAVIEYRGRRYLPYGTLGKSFHQEDLGECLGYLVQDGEKMTDCRVFTLAADPAHNFLMDYDVADSEMNQPAFWRAIDTQGKDIAVPSCIDSLDYGIWAAAQPTS